MTEDGASSRRQHGWLWRQQLRAHQHDSTLTLLDRFQGNPLQRAIPMNPWNPRWASRSLVAVVAVDATATMPPCGTRATSLEPDAASCVDHRPNRWHGIPKMPRRVLQASSGDLFGKQLEDHGWTKCPANQIQASSRIRIEGSSYGDP